MADTKGPDYKDLYFRTMFVLKDLLNGTWHERKGYCVLCGAMDHRQGFRECPAEVAEVEMLDIRADWRRGGGE